MAAIWRASCARWAYQHVNQVGSHIVLQTETPQHLRQVAAAKGVAREDILATLS